MGETIKSFKGFNKDLKCRGYQYEIGKEYEEANASVCNKGFHACEHPLGVFDYYPPATSRYCEVEQSGDVSRDNDGTKVASTKIKIGAELNIPMLIKAAFTYTKERCTNDECGGYKSALTGGYKSALTGGDYSALTGGYKSALTGGNKSALTGGDCSALTGGDCSVVYGNGIQAKVRGGIGSVLVLTEYDDNCNFAKNHARTVDGKKIKANTFYTLKNGRFTEVKEDE